MTRPYSPGLFEHEREHGHVGVGGSMSVDERLQELAGDERRVSREHEHVARDTVERAARGSHRVAGAARLLLDGDERALASSEAVRRLWRRDDDERLGAQRLDGRQHPVHHPAAEQRMEVLGRRRAHAGAQPGCHDDRGECRVDRSSRRLGRQDSNLGSRDQNPLPYHLATPQHRLGNYRAERADWSGRS